MRHITSRLRRYRPTKGTHVLSICLLAVLILSAGTTCHADELSGCWEGIWHGCTDGRDGTVKARITKCGNNCYRAVFSGRAFKVMPYRYEAKLTGFRDEATGKVNFKCTTKLPIWGCYWMRGSADGCQFFARYNTDDHVGYFKMRRVCCSR